MAQKIQISDFLADKYFRQNKFRDGPVTANIHFFWPCEKAIPQEEP